MRGIFVVISLVVSLVGTAVHAAVAENLYTYEQVVEQVSVEPNPNHVKAGLIEVLVKVTGSRDILSEPKVLEASNDATSLLSRFSFTPLTQIIESEEGNTYVAQRLTLEFDPSAVNGLVTAAGDQAMGALRPSLMVWLAESRSGLRDFVSSDSAVAQSLLRQAQARAVPVIFPRLDEQDRAAMPLSDLWGFFSQTITDASQSYRPNAILVGRLIETGNGQWQQEWLLLDGESTKRFNYQGTVASQVPVMFDVVADELLAPLRLTGFTYRMDSLEVVIEGVDDFSSYLEILDYMRSIPSVTTVKTGSLAEGTLMLDLALDGNLNQLERLIALEQRLVPIEREDEDLGKVSLNFRWQP